MLRRGVLLWLLNATHVDLRLLLLLLLRAKSVGAVVGIVVRLDRVVPTARIANAPPGARRVLGMRLLLLLLRVAFSAAQIHHHAATHHWIGVRGIPSRPRC